MNETPPQKPSAAGNFFKQQLKLGATTATIATVATFTVTFWINVSIIFLAIMLIGIIGSASEGTPQPSRSYETIYGNYDAPHQLLSIPVTGPIEGSSSSGYEDIFGSTNTAYGYDLKEEIEDAAYYNDYDGIVLEIDSPGGTIFGSKAIADGVAYYKEKTKKPVFASVQGMAASGAYWAAASADKIIADSGTGIGSIGVIYGPFTYYDKPLATDGGLLGGGVITQNGIEQYYITAGEGKDEGNPFRRLTDKEKQLMQQGVNDSYDQFTAYVARQRNITQADLRNTIGAHLFGETQALKHKLIDGVDSREEVYLALAKEAGIEGEFSVVSSHTLPTGIANLLEAKLRSPPPKSTAKPLVCTNSVTIPLVFHGPVAANCP